MSAHPATGRTALVVEDEYFVALSIVDALKQRGFAVAGPLATVEAALAALDGDPPDLALLDANLRGKSVAPVAERLAARGVPFGIVSGYAGPLAEHDLLNDAPRLRKPFTAAQIADLAERLLAIPRPD